jgi:transglutaminase-like putative cysteine protease
MLSRFRKFLNGLPRDSRDTLFLLLVIAWVLLPQIAHLPLWCSALAGTVLVWRGWLALGSKPLPGRWWLLGLLGLTIAATLFTHRTVLGRDAGVTMLVVLLTLKTLELRARRDAFVVFFLGFFCMLSNFFYSQSLLTAFSMLLGLLGLLTVLVNAHMPAGKPPLLQAARTAGWMAMLGAPIMIVLFMLFPRLSPLWGVPSDAMAGRSGLSPSMKIGNIATLALDDSVALRVRFEGQPPPQPELYFRGPVLSDFDGHEWRPPRFGSSARYGVTASLVVSGAPLTYQVTMEPNNRPWLLVMEAAQANPEIPGYQSAMQPDLQWTVNRPISDLVRYKVQSYPNFRHGPTRAVAGLREFVDLPLGFNPRTLALAGQIRSDPRYAKAGSAELVQVVMDRLRTGAYVYTLDPGVYGRDSADEFWFDRKEGFCEHIASAFVILMRALDVPARIVTGYQGGEQNGVDGFWVVRQSDAHAWAEVWQPGRGWVRVDPTSAVSPGRTGSFQRLIAPQGVVAQTLGNLSPGLMLQLRATWEAVNNGWNQWVLNYSQGKQLNLLKDIGFKSPSWEDLGYLLIGIVVLASLVGAAWTLWERTQHDPWLRLLNSASRRLAKAGIQSTQATTPRQLAQLVLARSLETDKFSASQRKAVHDWLMQLELQRYANNSTPRSIDTGYTPKHGGAASKGNITGSATLSAININRPLHAQQLEQLRRQFKKLIWPA